MYLIFVNWQFYRKFTILLNKGQSMGCEVDKGIAAAISGVGLYLFSHPGVSHPGVWGCENKFWP